MLVPGVGQSDVVIHTHIHIHIHMCECVYIYIYVLFQILFIIGYYKILNIVPCAIQDVLVVYFIYSSMHL